MIDRNRFMYLYLKRRKVSYEPKVEKKPSSLLEKYVKRQKELVFFINVVLSCIHPPRTRNLWTYRRTAIWYDVVTVVFSDEQWYNNFRVTRATFTFILEEIREQVSRRDTTMRKSIPAERRLALTLYYMASTAEYRTIAHLFGVSTSFVCICIKDVCEAINERLSKVIKFPQGEELVQVINNYEKKWGIPMCAGAIDGTHIPILAPEESHLVYVNRKGYHSIIMQAVVDSNYIFTDVVIGWPGSVHDARVLSNSSIYQRGNNDQLFPEILTKQIQGKDVSPFLIGDPAYPLLPWLMKPYQVSVNSPPAERVFNYSLSRARMTVENTFGRWKGRFTRFLKRVDMCVTSVVPVTKASCILHNLCEMQNNNFLPEWEGVNLPMEEPVCRHNDILATDAEDTRAALTDFFMAQQP